MSMHAEALATTPEQETSGMLGPHYDLDACVALMRGGSKSFFAASKLLPPRIRATQASRS